MSGPRVVVLGVAGQYPSRRTSTSDRGARYARAARAIAEGYFATDKALGAMLGAVGLR